MGARIVLVSTVAAAIVAAAAGLATHGAVGGNVHSAYKAPRYTAPEPKGTVREVAAGGSIGAAVDASAPGDTVLVHAGHYPTVVLTRQFSQPVLILGAPGENVTVAGFDVSGGAGYRIADIATDGQTTVENGSHDVAFEHVNCTLPPGDPSAMPRCFYLHDTSYNLTISNSVIRGSWIAIHVYSGNPGPGAGWVRNVRIIGNDISGATSDDIHVDGADGMVVQRNYIHDPIDTDDHNDGIQSQASNNLTVTQNVFSFMSVPPNGGPNQAIMLGDEPNLLPGRRVTGTVVSNNLITHWNGGRALIMNGTVDTRIVNNTMLHNGDGSAESSITVSHQGSDQNPGLEIWNNILTRVQYDEGSEQAALCDTNALARATYGGVCARSVAAPQRFSDATTYALTAKSPLRRLGLLRPGTPGVDINGVRRRVPPGLGAIR